MRISDWSSDVCSSDLLALAIGVVCTLTACFAPLAQYQNFLLLIGSVFAPLFGVVLVDHFILRKRGTRVVSAALCWPALLAWLGGVSTYHLLANFRTEEHPSELQSLMRISYAVF